MADITDPVVTRFVNEELRPVAEAAQALAFRIDALTTRYTQQIVPAIAANVGTDPVVDGRLEQGVSQVTKADLGALATVLSQLSSALTTAGVATTLDKFAVRPAQVTRSQ